ncbi:PR domain zinc finger protein 5-like [Sitodiplosis mosellana]|uniref:PR domain zinc finger protein 5-like n=1 Tax=Sitodiplosis mosellana TaxID=263140 RepID=UPI002443FD11|nr:PR domain zinc finger protein 5-like [Sitodiplosis mosellana]
MIDMTVRYNLHSICLCEREKKLHFLFRHCFWREKMDNKMDSMEATDFSCGTYDFSCDTHGETTGNSTMMKDEKKKQPCELCGKLFIRRKSHKCYENEIHECPHLNCGKRFAKKVHLKKHLQSKNVHRQKVQINQSNVLDVSRQQNSTTCKICKKSLSSVYNLRDHIARMHQIKTFRCHLCNRTFGTETALKQHIRQCHNQEVLKCVVCNKGYSNQNGLNEHMVKHDPSKATCKCDECEEPFLTEAARYRHKQRRHKDWECKVCSKKLKSKRNLQDHMAAIHQERKDFCCNICEAKRSTKEGLKAHKKRRHSDLLTTPINSMVDTVQPMTQISMSASRKHNESEQLMDSGYNSLSH